MILAPIEVKDRLGRSVILRNAMAADADQLIRYLKTTSGETDYLLREPEEIGFTHEQEEYFIRSITEAQRYLMLVATIDGKIVGTCSLMGAGPTKRSAHRCEIAIALYQEFCGVGIGRKMMETVLDAAKGVGYEQAELEVISENSSAIALYKKLGFTQYGILPNNMKYSDGRYMDAIWMMKRL